MLICYLVKVHDELEICSFGKTALSAIDNDSHWLWKLEFE